MIESWNFPHPADERGNRRQTRRNHGRGSSFPGDPPDDRPFTRDSHLLSAAAPRRSPDAGPGRADRQDAGAWPRFVVRAP